MIKFKTINGKICRMVEPTPLTPEAKFPCVVRLIQDDSPMGRYNLKLRNIALEPLVATGIAKDIGVVTHLVPRPHFSCECYELIGYPVVEGSKEWALWQAENGKSFVYKDAKQCRIFTMFSERELRISDGEGETVEYVEIDKFLNDAAKDGWQLYEEPKPEPIFTTGDKVTDGVIDGTIIHIEDAIADVCPSTDEYKIELRNLNHISESPKQDDVEKPLRSMIAEAKAIGKNIRTYYQDIVFTPQALEACLNQGEFRWWNICNWELTTREQNYFPSISTSSDEPKPTFKVGDWVEFIDVGGRKSQGRYLSNTQGNAIIVLETTCNMRVVVPVAKITRKLSPSEVVVRIGCLSGTVRCCENEFICPESTPDNPCHFVLQDQITGFWSIIYFKMLDTPTRELVGSLLKAQEEKCQ